MFSHLFLLSNNKYFLIYNNNKDYSLNEAINEYSKHNWLTNNSLTFNSHIETKYIRNNIFNNQLINNYIDKFGIHNIYTNSGSLKIELNNKDVWSYYGINFSERIRNPILQKSKMLSF
jgi:hypothetical protein